MMSGGVACHRLKIQIDFYDAYQYAAACKYRISLVCFDHDFDRTDLQRSTPAEINASR